MLPEFLDEQKTYKVGAEPLADVQELAPLKRWLEKKEAETNRQTRPAWIEVIWALVNLSEQRLSDQGQALETCVFETHIIARQAAKQRSERQLPTRFVTDEIKRVSNHQLDFLSSLDDAASADMAAVIGWYRFTNRRGLGFAKMTKESALVLCSSNTKEEEKTCKNKDAPDHSDIVGAIHKSELKISIYKKWMTGFLGIFVLSLVAAIGVSLYPAHEYILSQDVLSAIKQNKKLLCGVDGLLPHFSLRNDAEQTWWGLDVELCKALGRALEVDVEYVKVSSSRFEKRIAALEKQDVHILFRNTSHTITRDLNSKILFGPIYFYEREYLLDLVSENDSALVSNNEIRDKNVCVKPGTSNAQALYYLKQEVNFHIITQDKAGNNLSDNVKLLQALRADNRLCDFVFGNYFILKQIKIDQERRKLGEALALRTFDKAGLDPLAPVLLRDYGWQTIINFTIYALLYADKLGINSYNVDEKYISGNTIERQFLMAKGMEEIGLSEEWVLRIIKAVGNYSEIYYRSIECSYVACAIADEDEFHKLMKQIDGKRWPNKVFNLHDKRPGVLHTPRF